MTAEQIVDADVIGTDLEARPQTGTLFKTDDPVEIIQQGSRVADAFKALLTGQNLTTNIQGREHVRVEGWTTLGSMLGVFPVCIWTRKLDNGWEARVEARTMDGHVLGAAEAECTRDERMWAKRDDYALRSMAQTRATSKALRVPLGWIVTLAGYDATPSEEMPAPANSRSDTAPVTREQVLKLSGAFIAAGRPATLTGRRLDELGVPAGESVSDRVPRLTVAQADEMLTWLESLVAEAAA